MSEIIWYTIFLLVPAGLVMASMKSTLAAKIGPVVLAYMAGLVLGLSGLLPDAAGPARVTITEASLGLALPLLLFSVDVPSWRRVAGPAMLSMGLAVAAVSAIVTVLYHLYAGAGVDRPEQLSAMAAGMYTGVLPIWAR